MKTILFALAVILCSVSLAHSGAINNVLTFSPGFRYILADENSVPESAILLYGANIAYKRYFIPNISAQVRSGYWFGQVSEETDIDNVTVDITEDITMIPITLSANYEFLPDRRLNPYVGAGAGFDYIFLDWTEKVPGKSEKSGSSDEFGFSYYGVVGFDYLMTNRFGMGLDLSYNYAPTADIGGYDRKMHNIAILVNLNYAF